MGAGESNGFAATISTMQLIIWLVTFLAMLALTLFIRYSRMGRACRACAEDLKMASLLGINTDSGDLADLRHRGR